jgi:hypothetical protein
MEFFAGKLANALSVRTTSMRLVHGRVEHATIKAAIANLRDRHEKGGRIKAPPGALLTVMEFVDGFVMMGIPAHNLLRKNENCKPPWYDLGRLMAFDMLINNFDRLPVAWSNDGNLCNVMLGSRLGPVIGIDQAVNAITHEGGRKDYVARVCKAAIEARDGESTSFAAVKTAIYNNTAAELNDCELTDLRAGCLEFLRTVADLTRRGQFQEIVEAVSVDVAKLFARTEESESSASDYEAVMKNPSRMIIEVANGISAVLA